MPIRRYSLPLSCGLALLLLASTSADANERTELLAAKEQAITANFRNDQGGLRAARERFTPLLGHAELGAAARYHAAWTEWMLAASLLQDRNPSEALAALERAAVLLEPSLETQGGDAEDHILLCWVLMATATTDPQRFPALGPKLREHRSQARALAPGNPRLAMLEGTLLFYGRAPDAQAKGLEKWREAIELVYAEPAADAIRPDWGRTLAAGWLANLHLSAQPPQIEAARVLAERALRERPDFWYVQTQVAPRLTPP